MPPERILYWVQNFLPSIGGVQILASHLLPALRGRGYEFAVVASQGFSDLPKVTEWEGIPVYRFPFREALTGGDPTLVLQVLTELRALKRAFPPDLVHVNLTDPSVFFHLRTSPDRAPPFLLTTRMAMTHQSAGPDTVLGRALRAADRVTTISRAMLENLVGLVPGVGSKAEVVYNGLELPATPPLPLPLDPPHLLCLGRAAPEKGFDVALRALARLVRDHPRIAMTVAGDGPALPSLKALANSLGLQDRVTFTGWIEPGEVPDMINRSTLMLVPSRWWEGFGLVALQAQQMGRPVVASRVGGLSEVVEDGHTGILVEKDEPQEMADGVDRLLRDLQRLTAMGARARNRALDRFSWQSHVDAYDRIYREMVSSR